MIRALAPRSMPHLLQIWAFVSLLFYFKAFCTASPLLESSSSDLVQLSNTRHVQSRQSKDALPVCVVRSMPSQYWMQIDLINSIDRVLLASKQCHANSRLSHTGRSELSMPIRNLASFYD